MLNKSWLLLRVKLYTLLSVPKGDLDRFVALKAEGFQTSQVDINNQNIMEQNVSLWFAIAKNRCND